jgi:hypothetical protein
MFTLSSNGSWRSHLNAKHDVRRMLRADGMLALEPERPAPPPRQLSRLDRLEHRLGALEQKLKTMERSQG